jgi:protocatechuate 3,4-dioxygenase beta subunit
MALVALVACGEGAAPSAPPPPPVVEPGAALRIDAEFRPDNVAPGDREVEVSVDGSNVEVRGSCRDDEGFELSATLDAHATERLRQAVLASDFFGEWGVQRMVSHSLVWEVTLTLGERTKTRSFRAQESWDGVSLVLVRIAQEAEALHRADVHHELRGVEAFLRFHPKVPRVLSTELALPVLRRFTTRATTGGEAYAALRLMTKILDPAAWLAEVETVLGRDEPGWRRDVLACFDGRDFPEHERTLVHAARAELASALADADAGREALLDALRVRRVLLAFADPESLPLWVAVTERCSVPDHPLPAEGLAVLHETSVREVARLLHHERAPVRQAAAMVARRYAKLGDAELAKIRAQLDELVFPRLREIEGDVDEARWARHYANKALADFDLSTTFAERDALERARRKAEEQRRSAEHDARRRAELPPPPPKGDLTISGRVLTDGGDPFAHITVSAVREDGNARQPWRTHGAATADADGRFTIEGLVEGEFVIHATPAHWRGRDHRGLRGVLGTRERVVAGTADLDVEVALRGWIRGRLLDGDGNPVSGRHVGAQLREPHTHYSNGEAPSGFDRTDVDGWFWIVRLAAGEYDVTLDPAAPIAGGEAVKTGSDITLHLRPTATVEGIVRDERGDPLAGAHVRAFVPGAPSASAVTRSRRDGTFVLRELDPDVAVRVVASAPVSFTPARPKSAHAADVAAGAVGLELSIDTRPRMSFTIDGRVERVRLHWNDGARRDVRPPFDYHSVPDWTFRVEASVRQRDADGVMREVWRELGSIEGGEEGKVFQVPDSAD